VYRSSDTCDHWRQLASSEADGEVTEFERAGLERHRAECADCAEWLRALDYLVSVIQTSERAKAGELVAVQRLRHRVRRLPALAAVSAAVGAAFLAAIAVALPGRSALVGEQQMTGNLRSASTVDPPPRSLVLISLRQAQHPEHPVTLRRPQGTP
jgi:predicted anti-sigma-YlaC factor YlaD